MADSGYPAYIPQIPADVLRGIGGVMHLVFDGTSDHAIGTVDHGLDRVPTIVLATQAIDFAINFPISLGASAYVLDPANTIEITGVLVRGGTFNGAITVNWFAS